MEYENTTIGQGSAYAQLEELSNSDYEIKDGEPDITGWEVKNTDGTKLGEVDDLLFDPKALKVRYIILDTEVEDLDGDNQRKVLIPIGVAQLHTEDDEVLVPGITTTQLQQLSSYEGWAKLTSEVESNDQLVFEPGEGRTYSYPEFYKHKHFDEDRFYNRGNTGTGIVDSEPIEENAGAQNRAERDAEVKRIVARISDKDENHL